MNQYQLVAGVLWGGFQAAVIALIAGLIAQQRRRRGIALGLLLISFIGTLAFSYVGGFSIGRFTALIPVLVIGYVLGMGRGAASLVACLIGAVVVYAAFSWVLTPVGMAGGAVSFVFDAWGIPLYAILGVAAFGWAVARPPG